MRVLRGFFGVAVFLLLAFLIPQGKSSAQSIPDIDISSLADFASDSQVQRLVWEVTPRSPRPDELVTLKIDTFGIDPTRAEVSWFEDGQLKERGIGRLQYSFKMGPIGTRHTITVSLSSIDGISVEETRIFTSSAVDILFSADTYVPPLYKGMPLNTIKSNITLTAIPQIILNGRRVPSSQLFYEWKHNFDQLPTASGLGLSTFTFEAADIFGDDLVLLEVSTIDKTIATRGSIALQPNEPHLILYREDISSGVDYKHAVPNEILLTNQEISFRAEPYYFSKERTENDTLHYLWSLNGKLLETDEGSPRTITLRQQGGEGSNRLSFTTEDPLISFLTKSVSTLINFTF